MTIYEIIMQEELITSTRSRLQEPIEQTLSSKQSSWGNLEIPSPKKINSHQHLHHQQTNTVYLSMPKYLFPSLQYHLIEKQKEKENNFSTDKRTETVYDNAYSPLAEL